MQTTTAPGLMEQLTAAVALLAAVSTNVADFQILDDAALVDLSRLAGRGKQLAEAQVALIAGEIAARSTRELGRAGLAQREGFRSTEELLRTVTGASGRDASTAVRVGRLVHDAAVAVDGSLDPATGVPFEAHELWLADVASAVAAGRLSVGAADAIRTGLGTPTDNVTADALAGAAALLCATQLDAATSLDIDRLLKRARELRDDLDEAGIADRERERFEKRSLKHYRLSNGMGRLVWDLDPESYAIVTDLYDRATSPKRGVRFVSGEQKDIAERIHDDPRSIPQLASDTMLELLQAGANTDTTRMLGKGAGVIRVLVTATTLKTAALDAGALKSAALDASARAGAGAGADPAAGDGATPTATPTAGAGAGAGAGSTSDTHATPRTSAGFGRIEGSPDPISIPTIERLLCDGTTTQITLDTFGNPLDVGDDKRLFTPKQRIALAIRDGACMFGTCECPPSMAEAHHIIPWSEGGRTDLDNGILLCKFHHLLIHNNGWRIQRVGDDHFLVPPPNIDPGRTPRQMPSKSAAMRDLRRELEQASA